MTQEEQVVEAMRQIGGFATFHRLNSVLDFSTWATKTPEASVRRIVQNSMELPPFTYENLLRKARTVDVIWFNERKMPSAFFEVEHTTDIKNSLSKFYELQDFFARFFIVADSCRKEEFLDKFSVSLFAPLQKRVEFLDYNRVTASHEGLTKANDSMW